MTQFTSKNSKYAYIYGRINGNDIQQVTMFIIIHNTYIIYIILYYTIRIM